MRKEFIGAAALTLLILVCVVGCYKNDTNLGPGISDCLQTLEGHNYGVNEIFQLANGNLVSISTDFDIDVHTIIEIWNPETGERLQTIKDPYCYVVVPLANGNLATGGDHPITIWDTETGECFRMIQTSRTSRDEYCYMGHFWIIGLANGNLASFGGDERINIWNPETGECLQTIKDHGCDTIEIGDLDIDGYLLIEDNNHDIHDVIQLANSNLASIANDPNDNSIIKIWNPETGECLQTIKDSYDGGFHTLRPLPNGNLVSTNWLGTKEIWNLGTGKCFQEFLSEHSWLPLINGNLASTDTDIDNTITIWNPETGECLRVLKGHNNTVNCIIQLADSNIASASNDGVIKIWDPETGECLKTFEGHVDPVVSIIQLTDGNLASASDCTIKIWDYNIYNRPKSVYPVW